MNKTVSDQIVERLHAWGVRRVFGYPGDGINGVMGALNRLADKVDFIQARHEELAAFMATAHAKFTGEVGVCIATSGPGAIHLLNGLYDAKADHQPVVAIVGQQARAALGGEYSRKWTCSASLKTLPVSSFRWRPCRPRCGTWSTAPCASRWTSELSRA
jgi:pyruvate dehydrogenase (quinone)